MKIRKANINTQTGMITDVYLHENRKELRTLVAVPQLEWSTIISYEEDKATLPKRWKLRCAGIQRKPLLVNWPKKSFIG